MDGWRISRSSQGKPAAGWKDGNTVRFGIFDIMQVPAGIPSSQAYAEHLGNAVLADQLGLDYYFIAERHFMPVYRTPSPSVWLAALSARTERIRIGALGYVVPIHNPVRLAEEISMLDHLSGGRMEIGLGLGHRPEELVSLGIDPAIRQPMLVEALVLMQRAWQGEPFSHPGHAYRVQEIYVEPPVQRPHPPLWYTGNDPQAAAWTARNGLSLAIGFQTNERLKAPAEAFSEAIPDVVDPRPNLALMRHLYVAESDRTARHEMSQDIQRIGEAFAASPRQIGAAELPPPPDESEAGRQVERLLADDVIIGGSPETCARRIAESARDLGLSVFIANPYLTGVEQERVERTLRLFAERVMPRVRELLGRG
jgi:alkanesulfonate monooxygenase SsuD/methylene tetrahydromethanopterin reductase-like flavin-dependent oxidoreductase (luciferase family)